MCVISFIVFTINKIKRRFDLGIFNKNCYPNKNIYCTYEMISLLYTDAARWYLVSLYFVELRINQNCARATFIEILIVDNLHIDQC